MDNSNEINSQKSDNLPILRSTSKETRNRFDNLLKNALNQKSELRKTAISPTNLQTNNTEISILNIEDSETTAESRDDEIKETNTVQDNINKENYILEKFLSDATSIKQEDKLELSNGITYIKPPVPRPRSLKKKLNTDESSISSSNRTYSIASPKITNPEILKDIDRLSINTTSTYTIPKASQKSLPQSKNNINIEHRTKHQVSTVGDIIIHSTGSSIPGKKVIVEEKLNKKATKIDVSKLQPNEIQEIIDNKYKEIEKRRNTESCSLRGEPLNTIIDDDEENVDYMDSSSNSTSKLRSKIDSSVGGIKHYNYAHLIGVAVYRCDKLVLNNYINHPCVKVHIVDSVTGKYLQRSSSSEAQSSDLTTAHVYPLITKAYNMQEKRSFVPYWEELLTFNEDFDYMMDYENPVVIFFEILDFLSFSDADAKYRFEGSSSGWHKIAWAFLKPIGKGYLNIEQKLRLQLYKPKKAVFLKTSKECVLHDWWKNGDLIKYPSTIHVCVKKVKKSEHVNMLNLDTVKKKIVSNHEPDVDAEKECDTHSEPSKPRCLIAWSRNTSQSCKIPNKIIAEYKTSDKGCFIVKFSCDGYLLACGVATLTKYPIYIYSIPDSSIHCKFNGHQGLIYDFNWSDDDVFLITAASDCTVCIWNVSTKEYFPVQTLPHPSFVYCALLKVLEDIEIITGCYDKILRVWKTDNKINVGTNYDLKQELEGHIGYITSICSRKNENVLFSSDSLGVVLEWNFGGASWTAGREFKFKEYQNTIINKIIIHPKFDRLFVFCRDSTIRQIDLNVNCILQWYRGALNDRLLLTGCVTPCGTLVFSSSEDGTICIWNASTGILRATYNPYMKKSKVLTIPYCIEFHPFEHIVTFCHYGSPIPILLSIYNRSFVDPDLQLKRFEVAPIVKTGKRAKKIKKNKRTENLKTNTTVCLDEIIDKIDDVLVSANTL